MMEAVHRYEGIVNQVLGDGIMALFGAPVAHEDHAARACYAALTMQAADTQPAHSPTGWEILVLGGRPINEPVARYGPFVMNTREEIIQAIADYRAGRMGVIPPTRRDA